MKIIKEGVARATPQAPWWIGLQLTCGVCDCVVQLEEGDAVSGTPAYKTGEVEIITVDCPHCGTAAGIGQINPSGRIQRASDELQARFDALLQKNKESKNLPPSTVEG